MQRIKIYLNSILLVLCTTTLVIISTNKSSVITAQATVTDESFESIRFNETGRITKLYIWTESFVKKGQPLFTIENEIKIPYTKKATRDGIYYPTLSEGSSTNKQTVYGYLLPISDPLTIYVIVDERSDFNAEIGDTIIISDSLTSLSGTVQTLFGHIKNSAQQKIGIALNGNLPLAIIRPKATLSLQLHPNHKKPHIESNYTD